jgi:hypothetical protein
VSFPLSEAYVLFVVTVVILAASLIYGAVELSLFILAKVRAKREEIELIEIIEEAVAIDELVEEIRELDRKVNHFRHNIHCPSCGRFARQAEGWPEGVAQCGLHGIALRTSPYTGSIPIIVQPLEEVLMDIPALETSDFIVSITVVPDDLSLLLEEART